VSAKPYQAFLEFNPANSTEAEAKASPSVHGPPDSGPLSASEIKMLERHPASRDFVGKLRAARRDPVIVVNESGEPAERSAYAVLSRLASAQSVRIIDSNVGGSLQSGHVYHCEITDRQGSVYQSIVKQASLKKAASQKRGEDALRAYSDTLGEMLPATAQFFPDETEDKCTIEIPKVKGVTAFKAVEGLFRDPEIIGYPKVESTKKSTLNAISRIGSFIGVLNAGGERQLCLPADDIIDHFAISDRASRRLGKLKALETVLTSRNVSSDKLIAAPYLWHGETILRNPFHLFERLRNYNSQRPEDVWADCRATANIPFGKCSHRDLHASNVLISPQGKPKVLDYDYVGPGNGYTDAGTMEASLVIAAAVAVSNLAGHVRRDRMREDEVLAEMLDETFVPALLKLSDEPALSRLVEGFDRSQYFSDHLSNNRTGMTLVEMVTLFRSKALRGATDGPIETYAWHAYLCSVACALMRLLGAIHDKAADSAQRTSGWKPPVAEIGVGILYLGIVLDCIAKVPDDDERKRNDAKEKIDFRHLISAYARAFQ
jgi:hypothetical protein